MQDSSLRVLYMHLFWFEPPRISRGQYETRQGFVGANSLGIGIEGLPVCLGVCGMDHPAGTRLVLAAASPPSGRSCWHGHYVGLYDVGGQQ